MISRKGFRILFPEVQKRFLGFLCLVGLTGVAICTSVATIGVVHLASRLPTDTDWLMDHMLSLVGILFVASLAICLPVVALVGAFASMPLFGTLHRMHGYLEAVASGQETEPLRLRDGDPLHNLAEVASIATQEKRTANGWAQEQAKQEAAA